MMAAIRNAVRSFLAHEGTLAAAAISFYGLFSLFPLLLLTLAVTAFLLPDLPTQRPIVNLVQVYLPGAELLVRENLERIVVYRSSAGLIGLASLIWSSSGVFAALGRALEKAAGSLHPRRSSLSARILGLLVVLTLALALAGLLTLTTFLQAGAPVLLHDHLRLPGMALAVGLSFVALLAIYRLLPAGAPRTSRLWPGALLATVTLHVARFGFSRYVLAISRYDLLYGTIGTAIIALLWLYVAATVTIFGAEFNAALTRDQR